MFKLFQKKLLPNKKGFTLVELMIVIAIIGILAVVLIPQASKMREGAKNSGVEANMRMVQAHLEAVIDDNDGDVALADALIARIGTSIANPIVNGNKIAQKVGIGAVPVDGDFTVLGAVTIVYNAGGTSFTNAVGDYFGNEGSVDGEDLVGTVLVAIEGDDQSLEATVFGYNAEGEPMTIVTKAKTVKK